MGRKLVPTKDGEFVEVAVRFAGRISQDPSLFGVSLADAQAMTVAAEKFKEAFQANWRAGQSLKGTKAKDLARKEAAVIYSRLIKRIGLNESVSAESRCIVGIQDRPEKLRKRECPQEPPRLKFVRALHESAATPMHELEFRAMETFTRAKPPGADRIELFVDLVPPEEAIPAWPGANHGGRPWYLRSFTRSPIRIAPPMTRVPMRVVYWGRWADSTGNFGPYSATAVAWIEGGSHNRCILPSIGANKPAPLLEDATATRAAGRDDAYSVAVVEAQYRSLNPQEISPQALPAPAERETRRIEGPKEREAA